MAVGRAKYLQAEKKQPLVGLIVNDHGRDVAHYFVESSWKGRKNMPGEDPEALPFIGAWSDLDWETMEDELHRIRHQGEPTPPIEDL